MIYNTELSESQNLSAFTLNILKRYFTLYPKINQAFSSTGPSIVTTQLVYPKKKMSDLSGLSTFKQKQRQTASDARVPCLIKACYRNVSSQWESKAKAG